MSALSSLKEQLREKQEELKTYEKRYKQLGDIISNLDSKFVDDIDDVNTYIDKLIEKSEDGFVDHVHIQTVNGQIEANKEKSIGEDGDLSAARSNLVLDKSAANDKINTIKAEISSLERQIEEEEERERKEEEEKKKGTPK
ncbi:hypothetical protein [Anaerosporobacter faecicola]|uniref:hypothetical protein n=1 Tax=Anaerosporobacter faecicola TaxID=2718714 RepID=UPI00143C15A5|nr:hypothetical protein [Anaerosporobacter faecicola]